MSKGIGALASVGTISWLALAGTPLAQARSHSPVRNLPQAADSYDDAGCDNSCAVGSSDMGAGVAAPLSGALPVCFDHSHNAIDVTNAQVLDWVTSTPNQWLSRAHIRGPLVRIYQDQSGHSHLSVQIGATDRDSIEVIYNQDFGALPALQLGDDIESCGDYITSNAPSGPYPASPDGAILHWIHRSTRPNHESGYIAIRGTLYGY